MASENDDLSTVERFRSAVRSETVPLDVAALLISAHCSGGDVDVDAELARLDAIAAQISEPTLDGVVRLLFRDLGYTGDREVYYDPANSFLDQVLVRRIGIPITLSVLTIEVGRRAGVPLFGVGMPGHFLVGDRVDPNVFVDAFTGRVLDAGQAQRIFEELQPGAVFDPSFLAETPSTAIVLRMLNNLRMMHHQNRNTSEMVAVLELLVCLEECPLEEYRNLAAALELLGQVDEAARHLEAAAERYGGTDADQLRADATRLWARLN
jgi:regulator of sirC expression with transglutaminase-like and TPR domain